MKTHMNLKLPAADRLVRQDLGEGDGQSISEESLTGLTLHIQSCKRRTSLLKYHTVHIKCATQ